MSYVFDESVNISLQHKEAELERDIQRFTKACKSDWPRPVDYTNLIDAQYTLKALRACSQTA